jgi:tetratricopeptide (TPR) repeat protein
MPSVFRTNWPAAALVRLQWSVALILAWMGANACVAGERDMVREAEIEQQVTKLDPTLLDAFRDARIAYDKGNYAEAERLLAPICARLPNFDIVLRRLGSAKAMQGHRPEGIALAERAVSIQRTSDNLGTLAYLVAFTGNPSSAEQDRALQLMSEATKLSNGEDPDALLMTAQLGFQRGNLDVAREAILKLQQRFPDLMGTHLFAAYLAASDEAWNRAVREIRAAEKRGLAAETVHKFLDSGVQSRARSWMAIGIAAWAVAGWAVGMILLCAVGFALSKFTLRQVERADPNVPVSQSEQRLRRVYRIVLNLAGAYYYISLPIVLLLVLTIAAGIIYGFLVLGRVPIKLVAILVIGALATVWAMLRSLFLKVKTSEPGRLLQRSEAEALWQEVESIAAALQTRPVDEIRLTVGTDLCVYERGSWREKLENRAKRILVIGTAVLDGFKQQDFRCVLAHEYGHFANRDTAGGEVALRVQNDMLKFYYAMVNAGQATWLNVGFHFLRAYHFIFRRISHGATRLQEVLADRVAAQNYGASAFENGLRHVIRQSIAFEAHANQEIESALKARRPLQNLYSAELSLGKTEEEQFSRAMTRETTDDDTHPSPKDRFRLLAKIPPPAHPAPSGLVWDLFGSRDAIVAEMTATVEKNIASHRS